MNINSINSTPLVELSNKPQTLNKTETQQLNATPMSSDTFTRSSNSDSLSTYSSNGTLNTDLIEIGDTLDAKRRSSKLRPLV